MSPIRVADYIARRLAGLGVDTCFLVTGGGAMHLNDAIGGTPALRKVYCHQEQGAAIAAEGYARIAGRPALVNVTAGPGGINALNGVFGAFTDSIPMVVVSGQVKRETLRAFNPVPGLRQLGDQEVAIDEMVRPIAKWVGQPRAPEDVPDLLDEAWAAAVGGRPGPVWLDVPIDIQGATIEADPQAGRDAIRLPAEKGPPAEAVGAVLDAVASARRPVILAGTGIRIAGAVGAFREVVDLLGIPVTTAWTHDILDDAHPLYAGRPGTIGTRAGNFVVQHADLVLVLGSRLNVRQVSYNWSSFARGARKIQVDVDPAELRKPFPRPDLAIEAHLAPFLAELATQARSRGWKPRHPRWVEWCRDIRARYTPRSADYPTSRTAINPYHFIEGLFERLATGDVVACGDATATIVPFQIGRMREGMRLFSNSGCASMGYDLPAALGAAVASPGSRVICLAGDGSAMMNLQELQTIRTHRLRVKIFVLDNGGYLSIKQTQRNFFGRESGTSPDCGLEFPDFRAVGAAFGLESIRLTRDGWREEVEAFLARPGPGLCAVPLDQDQEFQPRLKSRMVDGVIRTPELEDMFPFLERDELDAVRDSALAI
jgi:acetolactate synthase-1/2/3 large subunit